MYGPWAWTTGGERAVAQWMPFTSSLAGLAARISCVSGLWDTMFMIASVPCQQRGGVEVKLGELSKGEQGEVTREPCRFTKSAEAKPVPGTPVEALLLQ